MSAMVFVSPGGAGGTPGPPPAPPGYEKSVFDLASTGTVNYWIFEEGDARAGPFYDVGTDSVKPVLTSNLERLTVGGMYCGPKGAPFVSGVTHGNRSTLTTPGWIGASGSGSIPPFTSPCTINAFMRQGFAIEKGVMWVRVANTGATQEYEAAVEILSTGVLRLRIETPAGNVTVTTDSAVWSSADRNTWKMITIRQNGDGGGVDIFVAGSAVAVTRAYTGTAGADTWIDDMLAYASRDNAEDRFRLLDRGQTESNLDAYNHVGVGGFAIINDVSVSDTQVSDLYDDSQWDSTPGDIFDVVPKICTDNGDDWPVWWGFAGHHMGTQSDSGHTGLPLARPAWEDNGYKAEAIQRGSASSKYSQRLRESMTGFGNSTFDSIQGESNNGASNWQNFNFSQGMIVFVGTVPTLLSGTNHTWFYWGRQPAGTARQSYLEVRFSPFSRTGQPRGNVAIALVERGQTTSAPREIRWFWDDADIQDGEVIVIALRKRAGLNDVECWINGTKQTLPAGEPYDDSTFYDRASWFDDVKTAVDAQGGANDFQLGSAVSTQSSTGGMQGGTIEHVIIDDDDWSDSQITEFFDALTESENYTPSGDEITVTIGVVINGATTEESGYEDGSHGSVSGSLSFGGGTIRELNWILNGGNSQFVFDCDNTIAQDSFRFLTIETTHGFYRYHTNRATFTQSGGRSRWVWEATNDWWQDLVNGDTAKVWFTT